MRGLSPVAASGDHSSSRCAGLSLSRPLLLRSTGSRRAGSVIVAHGPSCSVACGIFPDRGTNPCPLHWQADSQPLHHQGSPTHYLLKIFLHYEFSDELQGLNFNYRLCQIHHIYIELAKKCLLLLRKNKRHIFFIFTKNFIEQHIHPFVPLPSAIFQETS